MAGRLDTLLVVSESQIEEYIPTVREVKLSPDSLRPHTRFLFLENTGDSTGPEGGVGLENFQLMLIANDLLSGRPDLAVDFMRPSFDQSSMGAVEVFKLTNTALGRSLRNGSTINKYTAQSKRRSVFPRDIVILGEVRGEESLILSQPLAKNNRTNYALAIALARDHEVATYQVPLNFAGGNLVVSDHFVFTLADLARENNLSIHEANGLIPSAALPVDFGLPVQVLDHQLSREKKQRIYHLDLLLNCLKDQNGEEFFLLASLDKAKEILEEAGLLTQPSEKFNFGRWMSQAGYDQFTQKAIEKFTHRQIVDFLKAAKSNHIPREVERTIETMISVFGFPAVAFKDIGINAFQFFLDANQLPLTEYVETIRESLLRLGVPGNRIIDVPSLLFFDGFSEFNLSNRDSKIISQRQVPIIAPVNGIQLAGEQERRPIFITGGGIRPFDEYLRSVLSGFGVDLLSLPSVLGLGYSEGAFRCSSLAWK